MPRADRAHPDRVRNRAVRQRDEAPALAEVPLGARPFELLIDDLDAAAWEQLAAARDAARDILGSRTVWNINSTPRGGGVAEMLNTLLPYWRGSRLDVRWLVIQGSPAYFRLTKRIHNMLHGRSQTRTLSLRDRSFYERISRIAGAEAAALISPGDVVVLHDPQTAGLAPILRRAGAVVLWRCHVGAERISDPVAEAWSFLLPFVEHADTCVFTRAAFVPPGLEGVRVRLLAPAIDPRSPKNQALPPLAVEAILHHCGLARSPNGRGVEARTVRLAWGGTAAVNRRCGIMRHSHRPKLGEDRLVVALQRWDRLKDPGGIMRGFGQYVDDPAARLIVAGPAPAAVADDPEAARVLSETRAAWTALPALQRARIDVAVLPMVDFAENALIVNALQRSSAVVVKKSFEEGFGLGVTEALWKRRPVVASAVGGHRDQIEPGRSGVLVEDPDDLAAFGAGVSELLAEPDEALTMALTGHRHVRQHFLVDRHFVDWMELFAETLGEGSRSATTALPRRRAGRAAPPTLAPPSPIPSLWKPNDGWTELARRARERALAERKRASSADERRQHALAADERANGLLSRIAEDHREAALAHERAAEYYEQQAEHAGESSSRVRSGCAAERDQ